MKMCLFGKVIFTQDINFLCRTRFVMFMKFFFQKNKQRKQSIKFFITDKRIIEFIILMPMKLHHFTNAWDIIFLKEIFLLRENFESFREHIGSILSACKSKENKTLDRKTFSLTIARVLEYIMKKTLSLLLCLVALSGCSLPWSKSDEIEIIPGSESEVTKPHVDTTPKDTPKAIAGGGIYLPYTSTAVAQASGKIVLYFSTNWCVSCLAVEKNIEENKAKIPADVTILRVSYDDADELRETYELTTQNTFVQVDNTGKKIKEWRGSTTLEEIVSQIQ